jgi:D-lactate dehydrogenase
VARNLQHAYVRVREGNYSLSGLVGFEVASKTVGIVGTGAIGYLAARAFAVSSTRGHA